jgi:uncharacterized protein (DUF1778 family)
MVAARLEVRLDAERQRKLDEITAFRGASVSDVVRQMIDEAYKEVDRAARIAAAERLCSMSLEPVLEPDELSRVLSSRFDDPALY